MSAGLQTMPVIFFGHGSPMNALGGEFADAWRAIGASLPRPKAILSISAHWFVPGTAVTAGPAPRTIHDFYGFPKSLFDMQYPAPGDPWLARRVSELLQPTGVRAADDWGLDHGSWSVLVHAFPAADVPVVQLSIDRNEGAAFHYSLARKLGDLRDEAVLIIASGNVVHNLRVLRTGADAAPYDWADRFNAWVKRCVRDARHEELIAYEAQGEDAARSIPTPEHYLPLLYVLATQRSTDSLSFFTDTLQLGSISMLGVRLG
jgi:4,5-DOPA dioxygenase extradiol